jgi:uncharacterized protein (DUF1778 family)
MSMNKDEVRLQRLEIRLDPDEKQAFQQCADMAGVSLSNWVRERLRRMARQELEDSNRPVPFLKPVFPE